MALALEEYAVEPVAAVARVLRSELAHAGNRGCILAHLKGLMAATATNTPCSLVSKSECIGFQSRRGSGDFEQAIGWCLLGNQFIERMLLYGKGPVRRILACSIPWRIAVKRNRGFYRLIALRA